MTLKAPAHDLHQFLRLDTGARPFPPRELLEDAVKDVEAYITESAPVLAQSWLEAIAKGDDWKRDTERPDHYSMRSVYISGADTDNAMHYAKMYLHSVCDIDDPE
jgi:hypothetical protein